MKNNNIAETNFDFPPTSLYIIGSLFTYGLIDWLIDWLIDLEICLSTFRDLPAKPDGQIVTKVTGPGELKILIEHCVCFTGLQVCFRGVWFQAFSVSV